MKILFYTAKMDVGGCQINAINLAKALKDKGHEITFISQPGVLVQRLYSLGIQYYPIKYDVRHPSFALMKELADYVKNHGIDIIQAFDSVPILEAYGSQLWHDQPVYGMITSQRMPVFKLPRKREIAMVNPNVRDLYIRELKWPPEKLTLITERLDCDYYSPQNVEETNLFKKFNLTIGIPVVSIISRLDPAKWPTLDVFINTAKQWQEKDECLVPVQFVIVGDGPENLRLRKTIRESKLDDSIIYLGEVLDIPNIMNISSIVIGMASTCQQGLACGRPVIAIGEKGYSEIVNEDTFEKLSSYHFNLHDKKQDNPVENLSMLIKRIISNPVYMRDLEKFGRNVALQKFDSRIGAEKLASIYDRLRERNTAKTFKFTLMVEWMFAVSSYIVFQLRAKFFAIR